jgi:hypothetical protein
VPVAQMALKIFELKEYFATGITRAHQLALQIANRKKEVTLERKNIPQSFYGVRKLIMNELVNNSKCLKAVVSGSSNKNWT